MMNRKTMDNALKSLIKRTVLFLLLSVLIIPCLGLVIGFPIALLISPFIGKIYGSEIFWSGFAVVFYALFIGSPFFYYIYAKFFGLFKLIDELKTEFFKKILLLFLISALLFIILNCTFYGLNNIQFNIASVFGCGFGLIPAFFLYKFFQFLTKKYPRPFEKIGYYCSIEFYKHLLTKLKKN